MELQGFKSDGLTFPAALPLEKSASIVTPSLPALNRQGTIGNNRRVSRKLIPAKSMMVDARVLDSNMKSSASLLSASESMVESVDELRSIRELDEEHFGAIDGR